MPNDIATSTDGDLDLTNGIVITTERLRDRNLVVTRLMTIRNEVAGLPDLGIPDIHLGGSIDNSMISAITRDMSRALFVDLGLRDLDPVIKVLPIRRDSIVGLVQPRKDYNDEEEGSTIVGDFWTRDETITLLDGTEG